MTYLFHTPEGMYCQGLFCGLSALRPSNPITYRSLSPMPQIDSEIKENKAFSGDVISRSPKWFRSSDAGDLLIPRFHYRLSDFSLSLSSVVSGNPRCDPEEVGSECSRRIVFLPSLIEDQEHLMRQILDVV